VTLVAGEFSEIRDSWREVPVNYYVRAGREDDGRRMLGKTPAMIEFFSQRFGVDYPYVKYGQIVPELFLGAMENASATTHSYRLLADQRASLDYTPEPVVAHELVHQWHGDMIAIRDWSHTWLKESFATYFEAAWTQHDRGDDEFRAELRQNLHSYLDADAAGRRPIVYNVYRKNGAELFDRHAYEKGSLVLHMLRNILGEEAFWRALQHYTRRNREREVITADFERAIEEATGRSMGRFFEQWVYKAGHPEFKVTYAWDDAQKLARVSVAQTQKTDDKTPLFVTPVDIAFLVPEDDRASADDPNVRFQMANFRVTVEEAQQTFYFPLARRPFSVRFDQGSWLIKTLEFERPAELLRFQLRHDPDSLGRIEAAEALGKLADPQSIAALEQALHAEQFWAVRGAIAEALGKQRSEQALNTLLTALDTIQEPKARRAIVAALGEFRAPEQAALAERAAATLRALVERGEPSYYVEAQAATSLGKTRTPGAFEALVAKVETPSWNEIIRGGVFAGLGELGEARVVDVLASYVVDRTKPIDARAAAANGLRVLAATKRVDAGEARTKAVEALIAALGDFRAERPEGTLAMNASRALAAWGDQRAIAALEQVVSSSVAQRAVRTAREAIRTLQRGAGAGDEVRTLRQDLDTLREENRSLKERLTHLEARVERPQDVLKQ
ncbi:MAG: M1 family aminopeptidase, partial [Ktedonobacterales bacterium]